MLPCSGEGSVVAATAAGGPLAASSLARAGRPRAGRRRPLRSGAAAGRERRADDAHVEALAGDLDGVALLDLLRPLLVLGRRRRPARRRASSATRLSSSRSLQVSPLAHCSRRQQRPVERDQRLQALRSRTRRARAACAWSPARGRRPRRSAWPPSGRTSARPRRPPARPSRRARRGRPARGSAPILPGAGAKFLEASSALMRHSIAWPRSTTSVLGVGELLAGGRADALLDDVDSGRHLGHAVLDLHARVHLQEEVLGLARLPLVSREQALDRAGADVVDGLRRVDADLADALARSAGRRPIRAPATPRSPSGGGAGSSSRARRGGSRCRGGRRAPAPRRGAGRAGSARGRPSRRRRTSRLRGWSPRRRPRARPRTAPRESPCRRRRRPP